MRDEREAFEEWLEGTTISSFQMRATAWVAWQARAVLAAHPPAEPKMQDLMFEIYEYGAIRDGIDVAEGEARDEQRNRMLEQASKIRAMLTSLSAAAHLPAQDEQTCTGCEGKPSASNNPCAVCGRSAQDTQDAKDAGQWISVEDRLPASNADAIILFWPYDNRENGQIVGQGHHVDGVFYNEDGDDMHPPSHWMPMPTLPIQDTQDAKDAG